MASAGKPNLQCGDYSHRREYHGAAKNTRGSVARSDEHGLRRWGMPAKLALLAASTEQRTMVIHSVICMPDGDFLFTSAVTGYAPSSPGETVEANIISNQPLARAISCCAPCRSNRQTFPTGIGMPACAQNIKPDADASYKNHSSKA